MSKVIDISDFRQKKESNSHDVEECEARSHELYYTFDCYSDGYTIIEVWEALLLMLNKAINDTKKSDIDNDLKSKVIEQMKNDLLKISLSCDQKGGI